MFGGGSDRKEHTNRLPSSFTALQLRSPTAAEVVQCVCRQDGGKMCVDRRRFLGGGGGLQV